MKQTLKYLLAAGLLLNGGAMLFAPSAWYQGMPGLWATGALNPHLVRDLGCAYLVAALGLAWHASRTGFGHIGHGPAPAPSRPAPALLAIAGLNAMALSSALLLSACGGGGDIARDASEAIECSFSNCKESQTLRVEDISPNYVVTQSAGLLRVQARLGQSANLLTIVRPSGSDHLSASSGTRSANLENIDSKSQDYAVSLADASEQAVVSVNFHRGSEVYASTVTMPKAFSVQSPVGTPTLGRSAGKLLVQLGLAGSPDMSARMTVDCKRADGTVFDGKELGLPIELDAAAPGGYRISTPALDLALNERSRSFDSANPNLSLVQSCALELTWTLRQPGVIAAGLSRHGSMRAERSASHKLLYDARL